MSQADALYDTLKRLHPDIKSGPDVPYGVQGCNGFDKPESWMTHIRFPGAPPSQYVWDIGQAVVLASKLELYLSVLCPVHVALGGGCLYRGWSAKDLDLIIYPHFDSSKIIREKDLKANLDDFGLKNPHDIDLTYGGKNPPNPEQRRVWQAQYDGKRVDMIIMAEMDTDKIAAIANLSKI